MFAEPVSKGKVNEQFQLICISNKQEKITLSHKDIGLQNSSYQYSLRNIYYSRKTKPFTQRLFETKCNHCAIIELQRSENGNDFLTLETFSNEK